MTALKPWRLRRVMHRLLFGNPVYRLTLAGRGPEDLRGVPHDPWTGDVTRGGALVGGMFVVGGQRIAADADVWRRELRAAAEAVHGFRWLADLRAVAGSAARDRARQLSEGWMAAQRGWSEPAWRPDVLGERLANWLTSFRFLSEGSEPEFRVRLLDAAARQARHLGRTAGSAPADARRLLAVKGLVYSGVCMPGFELNIERGLAILERELKRQVLPDGGHFQRNPVVQVEALRHLIDVRAVLAAGHVQIPAELQMAIDRMAPMVRCLRHGDGRLALFNDGDEGDEKEINLVLAQTGTRGKPLSSAPHTGFHRLAAGRTVVIVETGAPAPPGADHDTHAGTLSFEMSAGKERLIVNCGAWLLDNGPWHEALRATAAHSTVVVDDINSSDVLPEGGLGRRPVNVDASRREVDGNLLVEASHDGYRPLFGLVHRRTIYLARDGRDLRGEDVLEGGGGRRFAVRFHLHPRVQASMAGGGNTVLLRFASGAGWRFHAAGGALAVEESVYAGEGAAIRRSRQIVISGPLEGDGTTVKWRLAREGDGR